MLKILGVILIAILFVVVLMYAIGRVFQKTTGKSMLKKLLWAHGIDWRRIPEPCLDELVADAEQYAQAASSRGDSKPDHFVEFERMLRVHAFVVGALLKGKQASEVMAFARDQLAMSLEHSLAKGIAIDVAKARAERTSGGQFMHDDYATTLNRSSVDPFDMTAQTAVSATVDDGAAWTFQEQVLKVHGVLG